MKFKSALVSQVSGSVGGATFAHNQGGLYMRSRTVPTNPRSTQQVQVRTALGGLSNQWVNTLSAAQRTAWQVYSTNVKYIGPLGDSRSIGALANYNRSNVPRVQVGLPIVSNAPTNYTTGGFVQPTVTATASTSRLTVSFTGSDSWVSAAGSGMLVFVSRPQNQSINFFKGPYRLAGAITGTATGVASPATLALPFATSAGQKLFYRVQVSQADGRYSLPVTGFCSAV